eukprot:TRINITY_DN3058_c0_g1_i4.p1 TRINITY_DN3058_c0_g1~~TRINITY_DN3058_c0_g1_i4.p1  ORF type:complete len:152 (-),score=21.83 TRINITY_DN3058_c0_g1_i4:1231-1686(-)
MKSADFIKEGDWLVPNNVETPEGPEAGPILHKILRQQETAAGRVTVELFACELTKAMKDLEERMRISPMLLKIGKLTEAKNEVEENYVGLKERIEKVCDPNGVAIQGVCIGVSFKNTGANSCFANSFILHLRADRNFLSSLCSQWRQHNRG